MRIAERFKLKIDDEWIVFSEGDFFCYEKQLANSSSKKLIQFYKDGFNYLNRKIVKLTDVELFLLQSGEYYFCDKNILFRLALTDNNEIECQEILSRRGFRRRRRKSLEAWNWRFAAE